jgi:hypothetical protein
MIDPNIVAATSGLRISDGGEPESVEGTDTAEGACALPPTEG